MVTPLQAETKIMGRMVCNSSASFNSGNGTVVLGNVLYSVLRLDKKNELRHGISDSRVQRHGFCDLDETLGNGGTAERMAELAEW